MNEKILKLIVAILSAIGIYYLVMIMGADSDEEAGAFAGPVIHYTQYLVYITAIITVVFSFITLAGNPKKLVPVAIGVGVLLVVYLVAGGMSSDQVLDSYKKYDISDTQSGWVGTGLISFYWLAGLAVAAAVFSEIAKAFK